MLQIVKNWLVRQHIHDIVECLIPALIQRHPEIGHYILSKSKELKHLANTVLYHHERLDGKGYPTVLSLKKFPWVTELLQSPTPWML